MTKHYTHCRFPTFPTTLAIKAAAAAQQEADDAIKAKKEAKEVAAGAGADAFATIATKAVVLDAAAQGMVDRITDPAEEAKKKTAIKMYKQQVRELETAVVQAKEEAEQAAKANRAAEHASREEEQAQAKRGEELVKKEADQQAKQEEQDVEHADATRQSILILSAATHGEHASSAAAKLNAAFVEHVAVYLARPDVHDLSACALDYLRFAPGAFQKH